MPKQKKGQDLQPEVFYCRFGQCGFFTSHKASLPRHERLHAKNKEDLKLKCKHCDFTTLQASNLKDHMNTHGNLRPWKCPVEGCKYAFNNRGSLCLHKSTAHGYDTETKTFHPERVGQPRQQNPRRRGRRSTSRSTSSTGSDNSRRRGRYTPYTPPTPSSSVDSSPFSPFSLSDLDATTIAPPTYSPELFSHLPPFNASHTAPQTRTDGTPSNAWLLATPEAQTVQYAQQPVYQQGYPATALSPPLIPGVSMNLSEDILDDFLRRHGEYQPPDAPPSTASYGADNSPVFTPTTFNTHLNDASPFAASYIADNSPTFTPTTFNTHLNDASPSTTSYSADNSPVFTLTTFNPRLNDASPSAASYNADNSPAFIPTAFNPCLNDANTPSPMASFEDQNVASVHLPSQYPSRNVSYEHYGHSTGAASFDAQFTQPGSIATLNMGPYPQTFYSQTFYSQAPYPQTFNQSFNYSYTAYPGMQRFYTN